MVAAIIETNKDAIASLCVRYAVCALWIFGSATSGEFDPATSDIDVLVDLGSYDDQVHRRYFGLMRDLENLLGRPIDLLTVNAIDNPYFREEVMETRKLVYGPTDAEAVA